MLPPLPVESPENWTVICESSLFERISNCVSSDAWVKKPAIGFSIILSITFWITLFVTPSVGDLPFPTLGAGGTPSSPSVEEFFARGIISFATISGVLKNDASLE